MLLMDCKLDTELVADQERSATPCRHFSRQKSITCFVCVDADNGPGNAWYSFFVGLFSAKRKKILIKNVCGS